MIRIAWRNILNDRLTASLAILLVALSVGLVLYVHHLDKQMQDRLERNLAGVDMILSAKGSPLQSVLCNLYHVDNPTGNIRISDVKAFFNPQHPLIEQAIPLSVGDSYHSFRIIGTTSHLLRLYGATVRYGQLWMESDYPTGGVVIGAEVAQLAELKIGDVFHSSHGLLDDGMGHSHDHDMHVVGVLEENGSIIDRLILTSYETVWHVHGHDAHDHALQDSSFVHDEIAQLLAHEDEEITSVLISFRHHNHQTLNMIRAINENTPIMASRPSWELTRLFELTGMGSKILQYLAWVIGFVALISVLLSLLQRLNQRPGERALLRVLGARPAELFGLVVAEGLMLVWIGALLGIVLCHVGLAATDHFIDIRYPYRIQAFDLGSQEFIVLFVSSGLGILAALIPAIKAYRTSVSTTLRES